MRENATRNQLRSLGQKIRAVRRSRGLTQEELASRAGVHPTYLSAVECGKRNLSMSIFFAITRALRLSPGELFETPDPRD
jgi:transcriptional regulator with XRE-family HTH domain